MIRRVSLATALAVVGFSSVAQASPFEVYGAGARGASMSAQVATGGDPGALYYNPAAMSDVVPQLSLGAFATFSSAEILLKDRPSGYDIPNVGPSSPALPTEAELNDRSDTEGPDAIYALTVGGVTDLGIEDLRLGALLFLPTTQVLSLETHYNDERERYFSNQLQWELIDRRVHRLDIEMGAAYQVTKWLSVGLGGTYLPSADVGTNVYLEDPTNQEAIDINSDVSTTSAWGFLAGALFDLPLGLRAGVAYRSSVAFRIDGGNQLQIRGVDESGDTSQALDWTPLYSPSHLAFGLAWETAQVTTALDVRYTIWSDYRDNHSERTDFSNSVNVMLGTDYRYSEATSVRAGLGFVPSPVPEQVGRTNYVDNDRIQGSFGGDHRFVVGERPLHVSWAVQFHALLRQDVDKAALETYPECASGVAELCDEVPDDLTDPRTGQPIPEAGGLQTGNPGFPGWTSGGFLGAVQLEVRL